MATSSKQRTLIVIIIAVLAILFGAWFFHNTEAPSIVSTAMKPAKGPVLESATLFPQPRSISPFELINNQNHIVTQAVLKGNWNLAFFGFTNCPDLCPTTLTILDKAHNKLSAMNQNPLPRFFFISVDPERDTPSRLTTYLNSFNPQFIGLTGPKDQIDQLTQELNVLYAKVAQPNAKNPGEYTIDHSGTVLIIDPQGRFRGVFTPPIDADKIAHDMREIMKY